jgi:Xaa-Pro aminopeptidase
MQENGIEAMFINNMANVRYLSGFNGDSAAIYLSKKTACFVIRVGYKIQVETRHPDFEYRLHDHPNPPLAQRVAELVAEDKVNTLHFEKNHLPWGIYNELQRQVEAELMPMEDVIEEVRMVKEEDELALMRTAAEITDAAFADIIQFIKPGLSELEIDARLTALLRKHGAEALAFNNIVASGENILIMHAAPTERKIERGDMLILDFGARYKGYNMDMTRTLIMGKANQKQKEIYDLENMAFDDAASVLRPGVAANEVFRAGQARIIDAGYGSYFRHGVGHGVGIDVHEIPLFVENSRVIVPENCVATLEPRFYIPGAGGVRIEDTLLVTKDKCETFFKTTREMFEL